MRKSRLKQVADGGLLERRSFLMSGLGFTVAATGLTTAHASISGSADEIIGERFPIWMNSVGAHDEEYGRPVAYEQHIKRTARPTHEKTAHFSAWHTPLENQRGIITPSGLHYGVHHGGIPDITSDELSLTIHGLVNKALQFNVESLLRYPMVSRIRFLECTGNSAPNAVSPFAMDTTCQELHGEVSCAEWAGVPLKYLLDEAGLKDNAKWAIAEGADGGSLARSIPVSKLMDDAIIALYQNGERLRAAQGYPMRLFLPGWEGNTNVKWLHRLEISDVPAYTKDESGLYSDVLVDNKIAHFTFPMDVKSVITHPSGTQVLPEKKGFYEISGLAWSGHGKIAKVEVSADKGKSWAIAQLDSPVLDKAFTRFTIPWQWDGTPAILLSRATDDRGRSQPTRAEWKSRYAPHSFNHYNALQAWRIDKTGKVNNVYV